MICIGTKVFATIVGVFGSGGQLCKRHELCIHGNVM